MGERRTWKTPDEKRIHALAGALAKLISAVEQYEENPDSLHAWAELRDEIFTAKKMLNAQSKAAAPLAVRT